MNLHDLNGKTCARGLEIPYNGRVVYTKDDYIYVREDVRFGEGDEILPPRLHRYKKRKF